MLKSHKRISIIFSILAVLSSSCDEAEYKLDNSSDPLNLGLTPPAIFFHRSNYTLSVNDTFSVELYSYGLPDVSGAFLQVLYDRGSLVVDSVITDSLFQIESPPIIFSDQVPDTDGELNIYIFALPTIYTENVSGTNSMAKVFFRVFAPRISELEYSDSTTIVNAQNNPIMIKSYGKAFVDAK